MQAGFLRARRCGRKMRVRINGAVRLVVISAATAVSIEVVGSAKEMEFMMPALMKTAKRCGHNPRDQWASPLVIPFILFTASAT